MAISKRRVRAAEARSRRRHQSRKFHFENLEERRLLAFIPATPELGIFIEQGGAPTSGGQVTNIQPNNRINGAIESVLAHPTNADIVYVGSINGGVWKTEDATAENPTWVAKTDELPSLTIGAVEFDTDDSFFANPAGAPFETLVVGTGNFSSFGGEGGSVGSVFVSQDGGDTWVDPGSNGIRGVRISGIASKEFASTIVVSGDNNGIYRSTDGGANFDLITTGLSGGGFNDLFADLSTYERLYTSNSVGIFRSDDFGLTWENISQSSPALQGLLDGGGIVNTELVVHPDTGRLFVGIVKGGQPAGLFHTNSGDTSAPVWVEMDVPILPIAPSIPITGATNTSPIEITAVGHGLDDDDLVLVNLVQSVGPADNRVDDLANGQFTVTVVDDDTIILNLSDGTAAGTYVANTGQITPIVNPSPKFKDTSVPGSQGRIHFSIGIDPSDEDIVYVGGDRQDGPFPNAIGATDFSASVFRGDIKITRDPLVTPSPQWDHLTDDSNAFDPSGGTANGSAPHADSRDLAFDANGDLLEVNDGGVYRRTSPQDNTGIWVSLAGTISVFEYHDIAYDTNSNVILAGSQDNGTQYQLSEGNLEWSLLTGGDGGDVTVDNVTLADQNQSIRYSSFQNLGAFQSSVWDADNNLISTTGRNLVVTEGDEFDAQFDTSVTLNALDPRRLLFGGANGVYESSTRGDSIVQTSTFPVPGSVANPLAYGGRSEVNNDNPSVIYAGDAFGNVHVRTEAAGSYVSNVNLGGGQINDVRINPNEWTEAIAIDSNTVVRTIDAGDNWSDITGNLFSIGATVFRSLEYLSQTDGANVIEALVLGTNRGVYAMTLDSIGSWFPLGSNLPDVPVFDMDYDSADDVLILGTLGRGAWRLDDASTFLGPNVALSVDQAVIAEDGVSQAIVTANLSRALNYDTTVNLAYSGTATLTATATNSTDYQTTETSILILAGQTSGTVTLSSLNDDVDESDETIVVDIESVVTPAVNDQGEAITDPVVELGEQQVTVTITDDPNDLPPDVILALGTAADTISEPDPSVAAGTTTVRAVLSQVSGRDVTVTLATSGAAELDVDYELSADPISSQALEIVIPAGILFAEKTISVVNDSIDEFDESLFLTIDSATFATATAGNQVDYTILDDDLEPTIRLTSTPAINESGGIGTYTANLSELSGKDVSVILEVDASSTATLVDDYVIPATLEILIPAGSLSGTLVINAQDDSLDEADETVVMNVIGIVNADSVPVVPSDHVSITTIVDDDLAPTVSLSFDSLTIPEAGGQTDLRLNLSAVSSRDIIVTLTASGTATGGDVDYNDVPASLTILAGELFASAVINAVNDSIDESDETIIATIGTVTNALAGANATSTLSIEDDDIGTTPELDDIPDFAFDEDEQDALNRTVALTGINDGNGENQLIRISASSSDPTLFADPTVIYTSDDAFGSLAFTSIDDRYGTASISVTVEKSGPDNDFATVGDNLSVTKTFVVTVNPVNDTPSTTDKDFTTNEDTSLRISASELLADSLGDGDPQAPSPQDESNQLFRVTGVNAGGTLVTPVNASEAPFATNHGQLTEVNFDVRGHLIDLVYLPNTDLSSVSSGGGSGQVLDSFDFTAEDDGLLIDANGGPDIQAAPTSVNATASLFVAALNDQPTLVSIPDQLIDEDSGLQTINLTGISAGGGEGQRLRVTATSSDATLLANPVVSFTTGGSIGSISFTPLADRYGTGTITVIVEDAGLDNILGTLADNASLARTFDVVIAPVNDAPSATPKDFTTSEETSLTITAEELLEGSAADALPQTAAPQDESNQTLGITAIAAGGVLLNASNIAATVFPINTIHGQIDAVSFDANDRLIQLVYKPNADFNSVDSAGNIILDSFGFTVADDGLIVPAVAGPNVQLQPQIASEVASIRVTPINDEPTLVGIADFQILEDGPLQTIELLGISAGGGEQQGLRITATSSNPTLFADPTVTYASDDAVGAIDFTPIADRYGTSTVTVTIEDAGLDNDFETVDDNSSLIRTFAVILSPQNDLPGTTDKFFETGEDLPLTITAAELFAGSIGDVNPLAASPQDESNQLFSITSIETESGSVTFANADPGPFATTQGQINSVRFDSDGFLVDLVYTPVADFNSTEAISDSSDPVLDSFQFTVQDDGLAINPAGGPDLVTAAEVVVGSASILVTAINDQPEINDIPDEVIDEGSSEQTIVLSGISAGGIESQNLRITATSNNSALLGNPVVAFTQGDSEATLRFTPNPDEFGFATITITLTDAGLDNNLATASDNGSVVRTFDVTVRSVNASPSFAPLFARRLSEDGRAQVVSLSSINAGANEIQGLAISARSDNPALIADPTVNYDGIGTTGSLTFVPLPDQFGTATITVTLTDSGDDNDLSTADDNASFDRTFLVEVLPIDDPPRISLIDDLFIDENSSEIAIALAGISAGINESQEVRVTATSSDTSLIADPVVSYVSPAAEGQLIFTPVAEQFGSAIITVTVQDPGPDGDLDTASDNQTTTQSFTVNVASINVDPIARNDSATLRRNTNSTSILPLSNDEDSDGTLDPGSFVITRAPAFGTISQQTNESGQLELIFTPSESFPGTDSFEYTISDDAGATSLPATVQIVPDLSPLTGGDFGGGVAADDINIDVLQNDVAVSGQLDLATLTIVQQPTNGTTTIEADSTISYVPSEGYIGPDSFSYTITDTDGNVSAPVTVTLNLVASGLNNSRNRFDVNASGEVTALDALLILNRIQQSGSTEIPVDLADRGPNFFDVNDNQTVSSLDAFLVLGQIEGNESNLESESVASSFVVVVPESFESSEDDDLSAPAESALPETVISRSQLADLGLPNESAADEGWISLLANDSTKNEAEAAAAEALTDLAIASLI